ncbi:hypothetical protein [Bradyrhizobium sp. RT3a]|uniref:hypothetical protein n=1 Tax=unclassified Bradyrhizobium TaxID=2631580 RepID=UPI0033928FB1
MLHALKPVAKMVAGELHLKEGQRVPLREREQRVVDAGRQLYGDRWMRRLAQESGLSHAFITMLAHGQRRLSPASEAKIASVLDREIKRLAAATRQLVDIRADLTRQQ